MYAVYDYDKCRDDELTFKTGDRLSVTRKGDEVEVEWWWAKMRSDGSGEHEGYVPRNLLGLFPRVQVKYSWDLNTGIPVAQKCPVAKCAIFI